MTEHRRDILLNKCDILLDMMKGFSTRNPDEFFSDVRYPVRRSSCTDLWKQKKKCDEITFEVMILDVEHYKSVIERYYDDVRGYNDSSMTIEDMLVTMNNIHKLLKTFE